MTATATEDAASSGSADHQDIDLVHGFTRLKALGGVESMLQHHWRGDQANGVRSRFVVYFEPDEPSEPRARGLGLRWYHTVGVARLRFARAIGSPAGVVAYHNFWGLPFYADLDRAPCRIGVLHSDWPGLQDCLHQVRDLVDGVLCVSHPLIGLARKNWPGMEPERICFLPYPVGRTSAETQRPPLAGRSFVLGFCGRLSREQKRVDRFPALWQHLTAAGPDLRLEFLGDGPQGAWLREQFAGDSRVRFHGRLSGDAYWRALGGWDAIVFASDYEGLPISMLEAFSQGVLPIFPRIGSGGDDYARRVLPECLYEQGDVAAVSALIQRLRKMPSAEVQSLRDRCGELVKPHLGECYLGTFASFVRQITRLPRISRVQLPPRPLFWSDHCPYALLRRIYMPGFWRRNDE